jgi:prophage tail gpP-like protein
MTKRVLPKFDKTRFGIIQKGGLQQQVESSGRLPPVSLLLTPLNGEKPVFLDRFLNYSFSSSILVPVDTFSFGFVAPDDPRPLNRVIREGDVVTLLANDKPIATGIIDQTEVETDADFGEKCQLTGRDLMGQLEDQSMVSTDSRPIYANNYTIEAAISKIIENTRIPGLLTRNAPKAAYLFAGEPTESKLSALQRFLDPLNCLAWCAPNGKITIGRPNMSQAPKGTLIISKEKRISNVTDMKVIRSAAQIANLLIPIWNGQENVQDRIGIQQALVNAARGPARLFRLGHRLPKTIAYSAPNGDTTQDLSEINFLKVGSSNLLQAVAKRELARQNQKEMIVQAVVPGHYNENGEPYQIDTVYKIEYDRGDVDEKMYLFQVEYTFDEGGGQKTSLYFCRLGTIVSDVVAP